MTTEVPARLYPVHKHGAWVDGDGNGNTDVSSGHFHRISGFRIQPDPSDGHTHDMTMLPCGWGQPHSIGREGTMPLQLGAADGEQLQPLPFVPHRMSLAPLVVGALLAAGVVIGGVLLLRGEE